MKIALISFHSSPLETLGEKDAGGMNVYIQRLSQGLNELDHSVDIFLEHLILKVRILNFKMKINLNQ